MPFKKDERSPFDGKTGGVTIGGSGWTSFKTNSPRVAKTMVQKELEVGLSDPQGGSSFLLTDKGKGLFNEWKSLREIENAKK